MQKIFDTDNADDMALLWSILPDDAETIKKDIMGCQVWMKHKKDTGYNLECIKINWHDKTEITRPIQEASEADIGKLCYFWDGDINEKFIGIFRRKTLQGKYICDFKGWVFHHCRKLTKQEIEELI